MVHKMKSKMTQTNKNDKENMLKINLKGGLNGHNENMQTLLNYRLWNTDL